MRFAAKSDIGRVRKQNQDAYAVQPGEDGSCLAVVADGMGGEAAGEVASSMALTVVTSAAGGRLMPDAPGDRLVRAILSANADIHQRAGAVEEYAGMGTTVVVVAADRYRAVVAHVGDSRAYLFRTGVGLTRLTEDHSLVNELVRRGQLLPDEAARHPQRHVLTRSLGPLPDVAVDCREWEWGGGDLLLMCSDGLTNFLSDGEISATLAAVSELGKKADELIAVALARGGHDNVTVVLLANDDDAEWRDCG